MVTKAALTLGGVGCMFEQTRNGLRAVCIYGMKAAKPRKMPASHLRYAQAFCVACQRTVSIPAACSYCHLLAERAKERSQHQKALILIPNYDP